MGLNAGTPTALVLCVKNQINTMHHKVRDRCGIAPHSMLLMMSIFRPGQTKKDRWRIVRVAAGQLRIYIDYRCRYMILQLLVECRKNRYVATRFHQRYEEPPSCVG